MANDADSAGTDLGRRIAEQRDRAGLTVAEAAERAGMSPDYLAYLESSTSPNPSQAALTRIAGALGVPPGSLSGAGLMLPPGQRNAAPSPVLATLSEDECRAHIAGGGVGRLLFVEPGRGPVATPVNYVMDGDDLVFRTGPQTTVAAAVGQQQVSFDVDHLDDTLAEGWSVLLTGTARIITGAAELEHAAALDIQSWAGGERDVYIRLSTSQITGRRIRVAGR
jgi:transcriptional regulator with XRE-family HTH domain